jgi:hypothetical protein
MKSARRHRVACGRVVQTCEHFSVSLARDSALSARTSRALMRSTTALSSSIARCTMGFARLVGRNRNRDLMNKTELARWAGMLGGSLQAVDAPDRQP